MNGGRRIAQVMGRQGVKFVFTLCGGHISPILVGAKQEGIRVIDVRQEPTAVFAADAISRLTGIPGVAVVTAGPGVTNSVTAIKNAQMAQSPLVLIGGAPATALRGRGALQDIEQIKLFDTLVKWSASIQQDCDIVSIMEEAFDVARSGVPGPVFIECPIDLLYDEEIVRQWYLEKTGEPKGSVERVTRWYLRRHVDKLFACSSISMGYAEKDHVTPFFVNPDDVQYVRKRIREAESPVMVIGSQATLRTEIIPELSGRLKEFGLPMFLTGMARGLLGKDHPIQFRHGRSRALKDADLVIIAGMPCDFRLNYGRDINRDAQHIAVNRSKEDLKKNKKPNLAVQADPGTFLLELVNGFAYRPEDVNPDWRVRLRENETERENRINEFMTVETDYVNPIYLCHQLNQAMDENSIIIGDGGDFIATASYTVNPRGPLCWLDPGPYGTLGVGAGFALAAKLLRPDADVWLLYGDGAAGYSLTELDTFVRHGLPVIAVIGNDAGWTQIARDQVEMLHDDVATTLTFNDYHIVANGLGAGGLLLSNEADIDPVLRQAKEMSREGHPVLINALSGKTDFRKGSISM
ncbi:MAG: thiamine pyrophosphate-binding protein [Desulfobacterales bacterium]